MQKLLLVQSVFALLFVMSQGTVRAQAHIDACSDEIRPQIAATTTFDIDATCQSFVECTTAYHDIPTCQMQAAILLMDQCPAVGDVEQCETNALLYAAALGIFEFSDHLGIIMPPPASLVEPVVEALSYIETGNYAALVDTYESISVDFGEHPMNLFSIGLAQLAQGDVNSALNQFNNSLAVDFVGTLVYYARGRLYESLGDTGHATLDFHQLASIGGLIDLPEVTALAAELSEKYPWQPDWNRTWLVYPIIGGFEGPGGYSVADSMELPPYEITIAASIVEEQIAVFDLIDFAGPVSFNKVNEGVYRLDYTWFYWGVGGATELIFLGDSMDTVKGYTDAFVFENHGHMEFLLRPAGAPDPRREMGLQQCPGAPTSRLMVGGWAMVGSNFSDADLHDAPGGNVIGGAEWLFEVVDGPVCQEDGAWWEIIRRDGQLGWIRENTDDTEYQVILLPDTPNHYFVSIACADAPAPRLTVGHNASVIPGFGENNLRSNPGTSASVIGVIPPGGVVRVLDGPTCVDDLIWWQIAYENQIGWTAEGEGEIYWLQPELVD